MCCKHFAAYDTEGLCGTIPRFSNDATVTARDFWETYMPAFHACVVEAQASHVMCAYNAVNGVPSCANPGLLNEILRDQWNFTGFVVGDYDAWAFLKDQQQVADTYVEAAAMGIVAGIDQEVRRQTTRHVTARKTTLTMPLPCHYTTFVTVLRHET